MKSIFEKLPSSLHYEETSTAILKYLIENNVKIRFVFLTFLAENSKNKITAKNHFRSETEIYVNINDRKGRIDLYLETDDFNIGIECKFGASLSNFQLETYLEALTNFCHGSEKSPLRIKSTHVKKPLFFLLAPKHKKKSLLKEIKEKIFMYTNENNIQEEKKLTEFVQVITWPDLDKMLSKEELKKSLDKEFSVLLDHFLAFLDLGIDFPKKLKKSIKDIESISHKNLMDTPRDLVWKTWIPFEDLRGNGRLGLGTYNYGSSLVTQEKGIYGWYGMIDTKHFKINIPNANIIFCFIFKEKYTQILKNKFKDMERYGLSWVETNKFTWWSKEKQNPKEVLYFNLSADDPDFRELDTWYEIGDKLNEILKNQI